MDLNEQAVTPAGGGGQGHGRHIIIIVGVILETLETIKSMVTEKNYSTIKGIF